VNGEPKEKVVTFRLTEEEYLRVDECAERDDHSINDWCRRLVLAESSREGGMTKNQRILLEEIGVIRHLFGRFLRRSLPLEEYEKLRGEVEQHYVEIGETLLQRRTGAREF
jgi:Mobilization protein NikA